MFDHVSQNSHALHESLYETRTVSVEKHPFPESVTVNVYVPVVETVGVNEELENPLGHDQLIVVPPLCEPFRVTEVVSQVIVLSAPAEIVGVSIS